MSVPLLSASGLHHQGSLALQSLGGEVGPRPQPFGRLLAHARRRAPPQEVADEELQAFSQQSQLRAVAHSARGTEAGVSEEPASPGPRFPGTSNRETGLNGFEKQNSQLRA